MSLRRMARGLGLMVTAREPSAAKVAVLTEHIRSERNQFPVVAQWLQNPSMGPEGAGQAAREVGVTRPLGKVAQAALDRVPGRASTISILEGVLQKFEEGYEVNVRPYGFKPNEAQRAEINDAFRDQQKSMADQLRQAIQILRTDYRANPAGLMAAYMRDLQYQTDLTDQVRDAIRDA